MEKIFEHFLAAYKEAYTTKGANAPMTNDIRTFIMRHYQHAGQQAVLAANRELNNNIANPKPTADTGEGVVLKAFVHPKAGAAAKKAVAVPVQNPNQQEPPEKSGRLGRTEAAKQRMENNQQLPNTPPPPVEKNPVVENQDAAANGDQTATVPVDAAAPEVAAEEVPATHLDQTELAAILTLEPGQIAEKFDAARILATFDFLKIEKPKAGTRPVKVAAILKAAYEPK